MSGIYLTDDDLNAIESSANSATAGPWHPFISLQTATFSVRHKHNEHPDIVGWQGFDDSDRKPQEHMYNAQFIAHARQDVPKLIACIRLLKEEIIRYRTRYDPPCPDMTLEEQVRHARGFAQGVCRNDHHVSRLLEQMARSIEALAALPVQQPIATVTEPAGAAE